MLSGTANGGTFDLTGTGPVAASAEIDIAAGGAVTQNGAGTTMAGTVNGLGGTGSAPIYTLIDGTMSGTVNAIDYNQSGGQTSGTVNAQAASQSGGVMAGAAHAASYRLSGGTVSGTATATTLFDLQDGLVSGHLAGAARLVKSGAGTVTLEGADSYTGGTVVTEGSLVGNAASIRGDIANDATVVFNQAGDATFAGNIGGTGEMVKRGLGILSLTSISALDWQVSAGGLTAAADRFTGDVEIGSGASFTFDQATDAAYVGTIPGNGGFFKQGAARVTLRGDSSTFMGATTVAAGTLSVNGTLGGTLNVLSGGRLQGNGTVGTTTIASGGTIAPGNSVGTLAVAGNITFSAGSTYEVEVEPGGTTSDLIHASGKATLNGATVAHVGLAGTYDPLSTYTIFTADGGIDGAFGTVASDFAFLDPTLTYDLDSVSLQLVRNDVHFGSTGRTFNQRNTGNGVDSLGHGNPVWDAVAVLSDDDARAAFDSLSGEVHASAKTMLLADSRFVRDAATDRVRAAFAGTETPSVPVMAYGEGGFTAAPADTDRFAVWTRGFGSWGKWAGDGNAAELDRSIGGVFIGGDGLVTENLRLGLLAGYSHSSFDIDGRASSGSSEDYHLGFYGGPQWGALGLRFGAVYSWHNIETVRSVAFPGFAKNLSADYDAATAQVFGELGYRIDTHGASFEPFAGLAYVNLHTDGFTEKGGAAALTSASTNTDVTFTTLGIRASTDFMLGGTKVKARGMLGWRHAFGDTTPLSRVAFAGGDTFAIAGVPIAKDAAVIEAELDFGTTKNATLGLSYSGQIGEGGTQDHSFKADFNARF